VGAGGARPAAAGVEAVEEGGRLIAVSAIRDHGLERGARGGMVAGFEGAPGLVDPLVPAPLRLGDGGIGGGQPAKGLRSRGLDQGDATEDQGGLTGTGGLEQPPSLGKQTLDPLVVGRCHSMCPRA